MKGAGRADLDDAGLVSNRGAVDGGNGTAHRDTRGLFATKHSPLSGDFRHVRAAPFSFVYIDKSWTEPL